MESIDFKRLAIFISGGGSNARSILTYFRDYSSIKIVALYSNRSDSNVRQIARANDLPFLIFDRKTFFQGDYVLRQLKEQKVDYVILAGFLWLIPNYLIKSFPDRILNIHPALLPKFGGKGMYGKNVHQAVFTAKELESGMTVHLVNEEFDKGKILFQEKINIQHCSSPEEIAQNVLKVEHLCYPKVIKHYISEHQFL